MLKSYQLKNKVSISSQIDLMIRTLEQQKIEFEKSLKPQQVQIASMIPEKRVIIKQVEQDCKQLQNKKSSAEPAKTRKNEPKI